MNPEQERAKKIISCEDGRALPAMAQTLAFETEMTAEAAVSLLASARKDITAAAPPAAAPVTPAAWQGGGEGTADLGQPVATNGLGLPHATGGAMGAMNAETVKSSWAAAVAAANASIGA